jgi:CHASE1-domain containing sensor protein
VSRGAAALIWRIAPWGIAVTMGVATLFAVVLGSRHDERAQDADRKALARSAAGTLEASLRGTVERTETVAGLYDASETVTRAEFFRFAGPLLQGSSAAAVLWVEHVTDGRRRAFEAGLGAPIVRLGSDNRFRRQVRRPAYDVTVRVGSLGAGRSTVGLDVGSIPERAVALREAKAARSPRATSILTLAGSGEPGILVYVPVFDRRTSELRGFAAGSYLVERLNADIRAGLPAAPASSSPRTGTPRCAAATSTGRSCARSS